MKKLFLLSALAISANAAIISQTQSSTGYENPGQIAAWTQNLTFSGFQSLVGAGFTLNSVTISINPIFNASTVTYNNNNSLFSGTFNENITRTVRVTNAAAMSPFLSTSNVCTTNGTVNANSSNVQSCAVDNPAASNATAILDGWNVAGNVVLVANGNFSRNGSVNDVDMIDNNLFSAVQVTVTYDYTESSAIPEPSTMALLGSALIGLGFIARKRK
jgi:hypothetical protein